MAENKKSFVLYVDLIHTVRKMSKVKAGELFLTILSYVNDENPVVNDTLLQVAFEPIKQQLKRDLVRWDKFKAKQSENGKLGGRPKKGNKTQNNPKNPSLILETQKSLNANANVNVNVINKAAAGEIDFENVKEFLRIATDRRYFSNEQIEQEALDFKNKYDGTRILNLKSLCNTWVNGMRPWQKQNKKPSDFV